MSEDFVLIKTFSDEQSAFLAKAILEGNEIACVVSADSAGSMEPQLGFARGVRLSVGRADVAAAVELLEAE